MFVGREQELNTLEQLYATDKFQFAVIYGRRRVGKTALINEFTKDKDTIFFTGVETNAKQNLENFSNAIMEYATGIMANSSFASFQSALEYVFELAKSKRIVLVIDEYPYVARSSKSLASKSSSVFLNASVCSWLYSPIESPTTARPDTSRALSYTSNAPSTPVSYDDTVISAIAVLEEFVCTETILM